MGPAVTDLAIAQCASAQPMGAQVYQRQILDRAPDRLARLGWSIDIVTARSMRSPLPGTHRVPLGWLNRAGVSARRAAGRLLYGNRDLVHRFSLELPPGRVDVVTLHDVIGWRFPDEETPAAAAAAELRRAAAVICVSEFSASEARELFGLERVHVVPNGVDSAFIDAVPANAEALTRRGIRGPYVLVGSGVTARKNLPVLAQAWRVIHHRWPDVQLVMTGPAHPRRDALFADLPDVVRTGWLPAEEIPPLVAAAQAVVLPSTYEGFGLPALEAIAAGTALVAADIPAVREAVGSEAILVSPDLDGLVSGLDLALDGGASIQAGIERGRARAREMTWDLSMAGHLRVWQSVLEQNPVLRP
ncbi:glycosyltransferase family 4 protein [Demetria terragena]|uniref:glycosyltransferase family 4 protein n=1 Tax=Demetria terragena TaxID=63959 RepID=UPI00037070E9|nr:glycosyltransferase family 1 protein [Demetria terragena]